MRDRERIKKIRKLEWLFQSLLIVVLITLTLFMLVSVDNIQGTARVINYTGIVRGATQRLVKLELAGQPNDELIRYLNEILKGLEHGGGDYDLVQLNSEDYLNNLEAVSLYWKDLQKEIQVTREKGAENSDLLSMSETYFTMADNLVRSAENFSQKNATMIHQLEFFIIFDIVVILYILVKQTLRALLLNHKNAELNKTAYIDVPTGLPNKSKCEILLSDPAVIHTQVCCVMFDLNNLKVVNDTYGHNEGDKMIFHFADILRHVIPEQHFLGRYGGDEFIAILNDISKEETEFLISSIQNEINRVNEEEKEVPISFARGYAHSADYTQCTLRMLLEHADERMYENKRKIKGL